MMRSISKNILFSTLISLIGASGVRADDCSDGPFEPSTSGIVFGTKGYKPSTGFCQTRWGNGLVVTGMEVWATPSHVAGVQFTYSDGSKQGVQGNTNYGSNVHGDDKKNDKNYRHDHITWDTIDRITLFEAATTKDGLALGYIHIEVAGRKLEVGCDKYKNKQSLDVGAGILLGAVGETNAFPSAWSALFMGTNSGRATITEMKFDDNLDDLNAKQAGISAVTLAEVYIKNSNPVGMNGSAQSWTFTGSDSRTTSTSTSTMKSKSFGASQAIEIGAEVDIPFIGKTDIKSTTTFSYEYKKATDTSMNSAYQQTFTWTTGSAVNSDLVMPGHAKHCKATSWQGNYKGGYTSTVQISVGDKDFTYQERGIFESISYTTAFSECNDVLLKDVPGEANQINAPSTISKPLKRFFRA